MEFINAERKKWAKVAFISMIILLLPTIVNSRICCIGLVLVSAMATMIKGIYKSFKNISKIFAAKEPEIEIGNPTDVKHVAHIGSDGSSDSTPSWMNDFNVSSDGEGRDPNTIAPSTRISKEPKARSDIVKDIRSNNLPNAPKKQKRKKSKPTSSPKSPSPLTRPRESRPAKPKSK